MTSISIMELPGTAEALRYPERLPIVEWAKANFRLSPLSAMAGPWDPEITPHAIEVLEAFEDPEVRKISLCFASQMAKSTIQEIMLCYTVDARPCPALVVLPTSNLRNRWVKRFGPTIDASPRLRSLKKPGARAVTRTLVDMITMPIYLGVSDSEADLSQVSCGVVMADEIDKFPDKTTNEGSPLDQIEKRTRTFLLHKIVFSSTPTDEDGAIAVNYRNSDQCERHVPCLKCEEMTTWDFHANVEWEPRGPGVSMTEHAEAMQRGEVAVWWQCPNCGHKVTSMSERRLMNLRGRFIPRRPNVKRHRGFLLNSMASWHKSLADLAAEYLLAKHAMSLGDDRAMKTFTQHEMARPWRGKTVRLEEQLIKDRATGPGRGVVPEGCEFVTMSIDVQEMGVWWMATGWKRVGPTSCIVDWGYIPGRFEDIAIDDGPLDRLISTIWEWQGGENRRGLARRVAIDSGNGRDTAAVYRFCCKPRYMAANGAPAFRVFPIKGEEKLSGNRYIARSTAKEQPDGGKLMLINTTAIKDVLSNWLDRPVGDAGAVIIAADAALDSEREFRNQLVSEERKVTKLRNGGKKLEWRIRGGYGANHEWDCWVYCLAGAIIDKILSNVPLKSQSKTDTKPGAKSPQQPKEKPKEVLGW